MATIARGMMIAPTIFSTNLLSISLYLLPIASDSNLMIIINPIEVLLWTFRRNEKDVVKLYNTLSDLMRITTGGDMLNFGYWTEETKGPLEAQNELCKIFGNLTELQNAKNIIDAGSGLSGPSILWKTKFNFLEITCLDINFNQLKESSNKIKKILKNSVEVHRLNATSTILPLMDNSLDRVLALESVQHMKPLESFILESKRVLKNNGILGLALPVVNEKINSALELGILSMTWSSEHYDVDYIKSVLTNSNFKKIEMEKIGSKVYAPLANYYIENRNSLRKKILSKYPSYVEKILFKSLVKMKQLSENNVIDYLLVKCKKDDAN